MAVNYSAGLNPMYDRFSQQIQQASNTQKQAQMLAMQRENDRYKKLAELGGAIGSSVRSNAKAEVDQFKKDASAEQKRLETLRDKYTIGSQSYLNLNNQIAGIQDKRDEQIEAYKDSGFLGFGRDEEKLDLYGDRKPQEATPQRAGLSAEQKSKIAKNESTIKQAQSQIDRMRASDKTGNDFAIPTERTAEQDAKLTKEASRNAKIIRDLESRNKKIRANPKGEMQSDPAFMQAGFTDPNTGVQLQNADLVDQEKRRYQEGKEKTARTAQMKIKLGLQLNPEEREYFGPLSDSDIQQVSDKFMSPDLRQKAQDYINQGITLDPKNKEHQEIAKAMNSNVGNLQTMINDTYEDNLYQDIQRAGTDYNALSKIQERAKDKNLTNLTDDRLGSLVEEAKQANRDDIYNQVRQAVNSSDPAETMRIFAQRNDERVQKLFKDGVINEKKFSAQMTAIKKGVIDPHVKQLQVGQETKQINLLNKLVEQRGIEKFNDPTKQNPELEGKITELASALDFDGNLLLTDVTKQKELKAQSDKFSTLSKKLSVGEQVRKKIYNELYGPGSVTVTNVTDQGSIAYIKTDGSGQLDPQKLKEAFARSYSSVMQTAPDEKQLDEFVQNILNYNEVVKQGRTPKEREQKFLDIAK